MKSDLVESCLAPPHSDSFSPFFLVVCVCVHHFCTKKPDQKGLESRPLTIMKRVLEIKISSSLGRGVVDTSVGWFSGSQCNDLTVSPVTLAFVKRDCTFFGRFIPPRRSSGAACQVLTILRLLLRSWWRD